jgi:hypothetical protein
LLAAGQEDLVGQLQNLYPISYQHLGKEKGRVGANSSMIYFKNLYKRHYLPLPSTTIKKLNCLTANKLTLLLA